MSLCFENSNCSSSTIPFHQQRAQSAAAPLNKLNIQSLVSLLVGCLPFPLLLLLLPLGLCGLDYQQHIVVHAL